MAVSSDVSDLALVVLALGFAILLNAGNCVLTLLPLWSSRKMSVVSAVISSISLSNVLLGLSCISTMLLIFCKAQVSSAAEVNPLFTASLFLWLSSCFVSFWCIAWLSVLYCVKVVSFSTGCCRALKRNISRLVCAALLLTPISSIALVSPFFTLRYVRTLLNSTNEINVTNTHNASYQGSLVFAPGVDITLYTTVFICLLCPLPLAVMLPTSLRLVGHLCQHTLALRRNQTQCQSSASYLLVCKLTVSLVAVYATTLFIVSFFFASSLSRSGITYDVVVLGCTFYCVMTGALMAASNRQLKDKLHCGQCCGVQFRCGQCCGVQQNRPASTTPGALH
ncbi:hypothetical protein ACEWY4_011609 [Coilia grayii]|uniref:Taste receptor type 2 n=1 Tax=Coilia grayii TaxID=363190 RepID=A0ABD1JY45_9TELE